MLWYPEVDDVITTNAVAIDLAKDKHPSKLIRSREAIQVVFEKARAEERRGLTYQAALMLKEIVDLHAFESGNHRTAYVLAKMFLMRNGLRLRVLNWSDAYSFIRGVREKTTEEIESWIKHGASEESQRGTD